MASISSKSSLVLDLPPSCIEFVPGHRDLFVVGTYHLERGEGEGEAGESPENGGAQQRSGSLVLFRLVGDEVTKLQTQPTPSAIFDLHFAPPPHSPTPLLGAATSTGTINLYHITTTPSPTITHLQTLQLFPPTTLITYFSWHPTIPSLIGVTLSSGHTHLCTTSPTPPHPPTVPLHTHDLEAWVLSFLPPSTSTTTSTALLTGGDDSALAFRRLPSPSPCPSYLQAISRQNDDAPLPSTYWRDTRTHAAGVTALLPLPANLLLTGSYDDRVRLLALPAGEAGRVALLAEMELGGGVWRLKDMGAAEREEDGKQEQQQTAFTILASCMHAGTRVLRVERSGEGAGWTISVLARFEEHASMNYGSDVQPVGEGGAGVEGTGRTVVSTSFYDRLLCVWRWEG